MKNVYRLSAIWVFGLAMLFAQGVEAQTRGSNGNRNNPRVVTVNNRPHTTGNRIGEGHREAARNRARAIRTYKQQTAPRAVVVNRVVPRPAIGARVNVLPVGFRVVYTPGGIFYVHNGVYYSKSSYGFVVARPPV